MAKNWKEAIEDLGERTRRLLTELGVLSPEGELVPVPVRTRPPSRKRRAR